MSENFDENYDKNTTRPTEPGAPKPLSQSQPSQWFEPVQPPKKGGGWMGWVLGITLLLFFGSLFANFILFMAVVGKSDSNFGSQNFSSRLPEEFVMGDLSSQNKILEIPIYGTIRDIDSSQSNKKSMLTRISEDLRAAEKDRSVKAILITINSPGGGITATDVIWKDFQDFRQKVKIPVVVYCQDVAASGGYYIASSADHIVAGETSLVGSIGVIATFTNLKNLLDKIGVRMNVITSKTWDGKQSFKDIGSFSRDMRPEERQLFQNMIQQMWNRFVDVIVQGRLDKIAEATKQDPTEETTKKYVRHEIEKLADGRIFTGKEAVENHLIDSVGYKQDAFEKAKQLARIPSAKVITYQRRINIWQSLLESNMQQKSLIPAPKEMIDSQSPQFMYLWISEGE